MVQSWPQCSCPPNVPPSQSESCSVLLKFLVIQTSNNRNIGTERIFESCRWFSCVGNYPLCIYVIKKVSFICLWLPEAENKKHIHAPIPSSSQQHRRRGKIINICVIVRLREHIPCKASLLTSRNFFQNFTVLTLNLPIQLDEESVTQIHAAPYTKNDARILEVLLWWCSAIHQTLTGHVICLKLTRFTEKSNGVEVRKIKVQ